MVGTLVRNEVVGTELVGNKTSVCAGVHKGASHVAADYDINYNAFTIDMVFKWNFAPGSWLTAVWKNIVDAENSMIDNYFENAESMFAHSQVNSLSLKLLYYIDYQQVTRSLRRDR